jgi:hypothetical protein
LNSPSTQTGHPRFRPRWMLDEELTDTTHHGIGQLILISLILQTQLFFRIGNEGGFDQGRRNIRGFQYGETSLFDM